MKVAVSFIKSKYLEKETIDIINQTSADYLHVDIMDGKFVENKNYDYEDIRLFVTDNHLPLDVHLMVEDVEGYVNDFINLKPENITFHIEAVPNPLKLVNKLHDLGIKVGLAINPDTPVKKVIPFLEQIDRVLVMTVVPGKGGQAFMPETALKVDELAKLKGNFDIEVDGGINNETIGEVHNADVAVSGSYVCCSEDYEERISKLK